MSSRTEPPIQNSSGVPVNAVRVQTSIACAMRASKPPSRKL